MSLDHKSFKKLSLIKIILEEFLDGAIELVLKNKDKFKENKALRDLYKKLQEANVILEDL